jgi:hypothetical protein
MSYTNGLDKPTDYFNTVLYTGNGSTQSITGVGFQPDWIWLKDRSASNNHALSDVVRGVTQRLVTNSTGAESTQSGGTTSFDSDGFSLGNFVYANTSGNNYVAWNWLAGGSASSNSNGSITSSVSAGITQGMSIVSWTGTGSTGTIGHGLGAVPKMIIVKNRDGSYNWYVYHVSLGAGHEILLNSTAASDTTSQWNSGTPTSSVFSIGNSAFTNGSGNDIIAYCFAEKKGYSKFGSYTGNGNADGTFVYTGFKPAFFLLKSSSSGSSSFDWVLLDNKRPGFNVINDSLYPNGNFAEGTVDIGDFTSNGFKIRSSNQTFNKSGDTFIYMAFAESPFVTSTGIPTTAR